MRMMQREGQDMGAVGRQADGEWQHLDRIGRFS